MLKVLKLVPVVLKYIINVGPLLYEAVKVGVKIVRGITQDKALPGEETKEDLIPGKTDPE